MQQQFEQIISDNRQDYVLWRIGLNKSKAGDDPVRKAEALKDSCRVISIVPDAAKRLMYIESAKKELKVPKKQIETLVKDLLEKVVHEGSGIELDENNIPKEIDAKEAYKKGFYAYKNCYHFLGKDGEFKGSNFIIKPLFHIYSKSDNKRLIEILNGDNVKRIIDVPTKSFVSVEQFQQIVAGEGNFLFFGMKAHFFRILAEVMKDFPVCNELKTLGWQREGFYAFANGIYSGQVFIPLNEMGIVKHKEGHFFSPAFSTVYKDVREDDDEYEGDRFFVFKQSALTFETWSKLMLQVYNTENNGMFAISYAVASIFREFIYDRFKIFPHLFLFGEKQSGKSQLGWSLSNLFFNNLPPFNLNSGTNVGFFRRLARFRNTISWFDEYTNDTDEKRFQALKAAYDGVGHEKGKMSKDNRTEVTKVNAASVISGQYMPTRDDNALFTRSIMLNFKKLQYTQDQIKQYNSLKEHEERGLSSIITEVLKYREIIEQKFTREFSEIFDKLKDDCIDTGEPVEERLVRNMATVLAPLKIVQQAGLSVPFSYDDFYKVAFNKVIELSSMISQSEALNVFWEMLEFLLDNDQVKAGEDFKVEVLPPGYQIKVVTSFEHGERKSESKSWPSQKELLYLKLGKIHPLYMEAYRRQYGKNGLDKNSLIHYMTTCRYYIGKVVSTRFENSNTSAFLFNYDMMKSMGINFDRTVIEPEPSANNSNNEKTEGDQPF